MYSDSNEKEVFYMKQDKGKKQGRKEMDYDKLGKIHPTNREGAAAWQNFEGYYKVDLFGEPPSDDEVVQAKDWVDFGSRL